jgi:magnesium-transporting ATPase (P-type)
MRLASFLNYQPRPKTYSKPRFFNLKLDSDTKKTTKGLSPKFLKKVFPHSSFSGSFNIDKSYPSNYISTTKYNIITFFPKCLMFQFYRIANIYFLLTAILQCFPEISPLHPFSAVSPFIFVITLSLFREVLEDYNRFKSDRETNNSSCMILCSGVPLQHHWSDVQVGNILLIKDMEAFPADLILLSSGLETGMCYIETSSLDGEKGLKAKQVIKETVAIKNNQNLKVFIFFNKFLFQILKFFKS